MLNLKRKLVPVQRKPRNPKTITKKLRKPSIAGLLQKSTGNVPDKGWANSDIEQTYTT